jgi:hypothetical protein
MKKRCVVEKLTMLGICYLKSKIKKNHRQKIIQINNSNNLKQTLLQAVNVVGNKIKTSAFVRTFEVETVSFKRTIQSRKAIQITKWALPLLKRLKTIAEALYLRVL